MDVVADITGYDTEHFATGAVVYFGGWFVIFDWGDILCVAEIEVQSRGLAPVLYRGKCVFLLRGTVWMHHRLPVDNNVIKPPNWRFFSLLLYKKCL